MDGHRIGASDGWRLADRGDYDGDGKADLLFQNDATHALQLWQMNGASIATQSQLFSLGDGWHVAM